MAGSTLKWNTTTRPDPEGAPEGAISDPRDFLEHSSLITVAKDGAAVLDKHFPGWLWAIQINAKGRVFHVFNHALHDQWGYLIRADEVEHGETRSVFLRAGGEILERFGLPRRGMDPQRLALLPRDLKGRCIPIINDLIHAAAKKEMKKRKIAEALGAGHYIQDVNGRVIVAI